MQLTMRLQAVPRLAPILLLVGLLLAAALAILIVGSRPKLPAPFGIAGNGRIAYLSGGQIHTALADGSNPVQLTFAKTGAATPIWSHDGTRITYKRLSNDQPTDDPTLYGDLVVVRADGSGELTLLSHVTGLSPVIWSSDDRFLVYSYATHTNFEQVFVVPADGSSPELRIGDPTTFNWGPSFSADGQRVSYISDNAVYVVDRDGSDLRKLSTRTYDEMSGASTSGAVWYPDGRRLIFSAGTQGSHDLWTVGLDGGPEVPFSSDIGSEDNPAFSPDGSLLAYLERVLGSERRTRVVVVGTDGTNPIRLEGTYGWLGPIWSPDGRTVVVGDDLSKPPKFFELDATGRSPRVELALPAVAPPNQLSNLIEIPAWQRIAQ